MESDLRRFYGVDYRDRWALTSVGVPRLTLRQIAEWVIRFTPIGGAVEASIVGFSPVPRGEQILDDLRRTLVAVHQKPGQPTPKAHPDRTRPTKHEIAVDDRRSTLARERRELREQQLAEVNNVDS